MNQAEALHKLLKLGPLEVLHAQLICGWSVEVFAQAMRDGIDNGWIRYRRHTNQHPNQLEAA